MYLRLGQRLGRRLFEEVRDAKSLTPRPTPSRMLAGIIAAFVHGATALFFGVGVFLLLLHHNLGFVIGGVLSIAIGWQLRPRLGKRPSRVVPRERAPALYGLLDRVGEALHVRRVDGIVLTSDFNASISRVGWERRTYVTLGIPLLACLAPQERVAILGHELGHQGNGDPRRGSFVGTALGTLESWAMLLRPQPGNVVYRSHEVSALASMLANGVLAILSRIVRLIAVLLIHLIWRASQRAEYLADELAARVAGSEASVSALRKLGLQSVFREVVQSATLNAPADVGLIEDFRRRVGSYPHAELERELSKEIDRGFRLDVTHPPSAYRIEFLRNRPAPAEVVLSSAESDRIDEELLPYEKDVHDHLVERYRASLYRGNR
jgi:Zn-dependent protease with chaperone function